MKKKTDIRDVAALAGVSVGSASRVLNGFENVSKQTRAKVQQAMEALDWRPNCAARWLRSRSTKTIGCLFPDVANPLYAGVFRALEERFRRAGYMLLLAHGLNDPVRETEALQMFGHRGMDGVIAAPGNEKHDAVRKALAALEMPVVILDRDIAGSRHDAVLFGHAAGVRACVCELLGQGHRRIALVLWQARSRPVRRRIEGYRAAFRNAGLTPPQLLVQAACATGSAYAQVDALLSQSAAPTALITQGTFTLNSVLHAIAAHGLRVAQDVSVVAIGDSDFARHHRPAISALRVDLEQVAEAAVQLIDSRMLAPDLSPRTVKIALEFVSRDSVRAPPQ